MDISSPRSLVTQNTGGDWWCVSLCRCFRTAGDEALDLKAPSDPSPPSPPSPRQSDQSPPDAVQVGSWISWTTGSRCFKNLQDCKSCLVLWEVLFFSFQPQLWTVGDSGRGTSAETSSGSSGASTGTAEVDGSTSVGASVWWPGVS